MIYKGKDPVEGREKTSEQLFSDEKTDEKIRRHFSDINDVITEADIENVKTNFDETGETDERNTAPKSGKTGREKGKETGDDEEPSNQPAPLITPWNVINP